MKPCLLFAIIGVLQISLSAQNFEYALTQSEFNGSEINEIVVVDDKVYLAGGLGWCHNPTLWTLDTTGQLLDYQVLATLFRYGSIKSLRFDDTARVFTAMMTVSNDIAFRQQSIYVVQLDDNLEPQAEFDFSAQSGDASSPSAFLSETGLMILSDKALLLFDADFQLTNEITLPDEISQASAIEVYQHQTLLYNDTFRDILHSVDLLSNKVVTMQTPYFTSLVIYRDFLFLSTSDVIHKYDIATLEVLDSIQFDNVEDVELVVINEGFLEVILHRPGQHSLLGYYTEDLRSIFEVPFLPEYERNFRGDISGKRTLYQVSAFRKHGGDRSLPSFRSKNLIPVIRKQRIPYPFEIERPALEITNVQVLNEVTPIFCNTANGEDYCVFDGGDFLHYELTIKNTGSLAIDNLGYYTSNFNSIICIEDIGYRYRDQLNLEPQQEITIRDSLQMGVIANYPNLDFYVTAPNHILTEDGVSVFTLSDLSTGVRETSAILPLAIYPNPSQDFLQIEKNEFIADYETIEILSAAGQVIIKPMLTGHKIDIAELPQGLYFVRLFGAKDIRQNSFIKQ